MRAKFGDMAHETGCTTGDPCISARALCCVVILSHRKDYGKNNYSIPLFRYDNLLMRKASVAGTVHVPAKIKYK